MHNDLIVHAHGETGCMHLSLTAVVYSILQMHSKNCGNDNRILEIKNEND